MNVAIYARVSTQRQAQSQSIDQQLDRLRTHCRDQGWTLSQDAIFRDDGYSGASLNRPGLDQLRDRIKSGDIERVLITAPDRLGRKYAHQSIIIDEFERLGCQLEFLDRPMGQDPHDQLLLQIRGAVAEYERTLIAERMRRGRQARSRAGTLLPSSRLPYGYRGNLERPRDPDGVALDPAEAAVVAELFVLYLEGRTLMDLVRHLQCLGVDSPTGKA